MTTKGNQGLLARIKSDVKNRPNFYEIKGI